MFDVMLLVAKQVQGVSWKKFIADFQEKKLFFQNILLQTSTDSVTTETRISSTSLITIDLLPLTG
jgi:hypothetical protein